jgi:hypothetical protein
MSVTRLRGCGRGAGRCWQNQRGAARRCSSFVRRLSSRLASRRCRRSSAAMARRSLVSLRSGPPTDRDHMAAQSRSGVTGCAGMVAVSLICAILCVRKGSRVRSDAHGEGHDSGGSAAERGRSLMRTGKSAAPVGGPTGVARATDGRLSFLWLEITGRCQLACRHCYAESGPRGTHGSMATRSGCE